MLTETKDVLIHGFYGAGNVGDDAILESMVDQIAELPEVNSITVSVYGNRPAYHGLHPVELVPGRDLDRLCKAIEASHVLIVGGGGLLQDYHGFRLSDLLDKPLASAAKSSALGYYGLPLVIARVLGRPAMLYAVGVGPFASNEAAHTAGWLAQSVNAATVRDRGSAELLQGLGVTNVSVTADPAVSLGACCGADGEGDRAPDERRLAGAGEGRTLVGVNLRTWPFSKSIGHDTLELARGVARWLADEKGAGVLILPFNSGRNELRLARELQGSLPRGASEILSEANTPAAMLATCRRLDLVIGMRLHASVLSMAAGTPAIGLAYDPKVRRFFEEAGVPELCLDAGGTTLEALQVRVGEVLGDLPKWRSRVRAGIDVLREREQHNLRVLSRLLAAGPAPTE
ncbi:MAG: polysaccharide pyruvyl transferase family protein [Bacillota bacterium]|nr:polysaccharide pyruvyl transferase family protein [Bacillota bacterium]